MHHDLDATLDEEDRPEKIEEEADILFIGSDGVASVVGHAGSLRAEGRGAAAGRSGIRPAEPGAQWAGVRLRRTATGRLRRCRRSYEISRIDAWSIRGD